MHVVWDERPLALDAPPQMHALPPGRIYVCDGGPRQGPCYQCVEEDRCRYSRWDVYINPGLISGFNCQLNLIVLGYLGRFCTGTYTAYINPGARANWCSHCRAWGHQFNYDGCRLRVEALMAELEHEAAVEGRVARERARRGWFLQGILPNRRAPE